ncbi:protein archease [Thermus composti]|uniref:Archease n=1 Tax=Thermus composti TaxID=532059 RepID=A0ABV6Q2N0_9DEIN|nr:archease [Thermus composti]GGM96021.1 protein archease [Thermus composti]
MVVRPLDHTADIGFVLEAQSLPELFEAALKGLLQAMFQNPPQGGKKRRRIALEAEDLETLLVRYLNELIYLIQTKGFVPGKARIRVEEAENGYRLTATLFGEPFQEAFGFQGEVKSATFHGLKVEKSQGRWRAQVILDV